MVTAAALRFIAEEQDENKLYQLGSSCFKAVAVKMEKRGRMWKLFEEQLEGMYLLRYWQ